MTVLQRMLAGNNQLHLERVTPDNKLTRYAVFYGVADKYDCPSYKNTIQKAYIRTLAGYFFIPDFVNSIKIVYTTTPGSDKGLRKWAVWVAQGYIAELQLHGCFKELFTSRPDFIWDFSTQYRRVDRSWYTECHQSSWTACVCDNNGICARSLACEQERPERVSCQNCRKNNCIVPFSAAPSSNRVRQLVINGNTDEALHRVLNRR